MWRASSHELIVSACLTAARDIVRYIDAGRRNPDHTFNTLNFDLVAEVSSAVGRLKRSLRACGYAPPLDDEIIALPRRILGDVALDHALSELWYIAHRWDSIPFAKRMEKLEWAIETTRQFIESRLDEHNADNGKAPATVIPHQDQKNDETGKALRNGFFQPDGFRFNGKTVRFRKAALQYRLLKALWDTRKAKPKTRSETVVIGLVYGEDDLGDSNKFIQLCTDTNKRMATEAVPLTITRMQGMVSLLEL